MSQYAYRAKRDVATEAQGVIDAQTLAEAVGALKAQGLFPFDVHPVAAVGPSPRTAMIQPIPPTATRRLGAPAVALWARTMAQGLHGGLTVTRALQLLVDQETRHPVGRIATSLRDLVTQGQSLSQAMVAVGAFSPVAVALVQAGEASGSLEQALDRIARAAERQHELAGKVRAALAYPALILTVGAATTTFLVLVVVPRLAILFVELGQPLPWPTRVMLGARDLLGQGVAVGVLGAVIVRLRWRQSDHRAWWGQQARRVVGRLPIVGAVLVKAELASWSGLLGLMLGQGVALPHAVKLVNRTVADQDLQRRLSRLESDVLEGIPIAASLRQTMLPAPLLMTMTAIGEAEGALDTSLLNVAATYERDVDQGVKVISSLVEPMLILVVALVVAAIVLSTLLPIFNMNFGVS